MFLITFRSFAAEPLLPMGAVNEITIKQVPFYQTILWKNQPFDQLDTAYLKLTRYVVGQGFGTIKPLILEIPNLDWQPEQPISFALPLPTEQQTEWPKDMSLFFDSHESSRVIALAFKGGYEFSAIEPQLKKMKRWMVENHLISAGNPRLLLYHYRSFRLDCWRATELQQPIR